MSLDIPSLQQAALRSCIAYRKLHDVLSPENHSTVLFEHLKKIWEDKELDCLRSEYCNLKLFTILLDEKYRTTLLKSFSSVNIRSDKPSVAKVLLESYKESNAIKNDIQLGLKFAQFFIELGNFKPAFRFLEIVKETCKATNNQVILLECYSQFIYALSFQYRFKHALRMYSHVQNIFNELSPLPNRANVFSNISYMHFMLGDYSQALLYANAAIRELNDHLPVKVIIKVLRISAKIFIINREHRQARLLIHHALTLTKDYVESDPYIFAEVYMDLGFYLAQMNEFLLSIDVYQNTINIYKKLYEEPNLYHIIAERELVFSELKLIQQQTPPKKLNKFLYLAASNHITSAAKDMLKLEDENNMMHPNAINEARALLLEIFGLYGASTPTERTKFLTTAKQCYETSLRSHRLVFDESRNEPSIKTANCLVSIGRVCQYLKEFQNAESAFKEAEAITGNLESRSNAEYFSVKLHRARLYRLNTEFFKRKGTILQAIKTMEQCKRLLIKFEGDGCEILHKFYEELIKLYEQNKNVAKVIQYRKELLECRQISNVQKFKPFTDFLRKTEPMKTIIDKISKMNVEMKEMKFEYAINRQKYKLNSSAFFYGSIE